MRIGELPDKIERNANGIGCWRFQKHDGYATLYDGVRWLKLNRFMWELLHGPIPSDMLVCHSCDQPWCINPEHLFLGTYKENYEDAKAKNRLLPAKSYVDGLKKSLFIEPDNIDALYLWAREEGRSINDQLNWIIRERQNGDSVFRRQSVEAWLEEQEQ